MNRFKDIKKLLLLPVGGGNDGVSSLWLLRQLAESGLRPREVDMLCMLPDGIQYHRTINTTCPRLVEINKDVYRTINGSKIKAFPEPTLAGSKSQFGLRHIFGAHLTAGSLGFAETLRSLVETEDYDLVLAVDVGGDFIALPENLAVLSPFMDAYGAFALQKLQEAQLVNIIGAVTGLGTDGETEPNLLPKTIANIKPFYEGELVAETVQPITDFYIKQVKALRRSQTGDLMVDALTNQLKTAYTVTRYFHVLTPQGSKKYTANQTFHLDHQYNKKFYLFNDFNRISNRFVCACATSLEWVKQTQDAKVRFQHELVNQVIEETLVATPSWIFPEESRNEILTVIGHGLRAGLYKKAVAYAKDLEFIGKSSNVEIVG